jgi:dTMP kinase
MTMIVAIEGIDGCGKTTQAFLLSSDLKIEQLRFPDYNTMPQIRDFLEGKIQVHPKALFLMYLADICQGIYKSGFEKKPILLDRYVYSTVAYARTLDRKVAMSIIKEIAPPIPDIVFWMDISAETALERKANHKTPDRYEKDLEFMKEVRSVYEDMHKSKFYAKEWIRLDATRKIEDVHAEIMAKLKGKIPEKK